MPRPTNPGGGNGGGGEDGGTIQVSGTNNNDILTIPHGYTIETVSFDGMKGIDTLDLSNQSSGVTISLDNRKGQKSLASNDDFTGILWSETSWVGDIGTSTSVEGTIKNIENLIGTQGRDRFLIRDANHNRVDGGADNDAITVTGGGDTVIGGAGEDWLRGYGEGNILVGGSWSEADGSAGTLPGGDDQSDVFSLRAGAVLDFEVGLDRLVIEAETYEDMSAIAASQWKQGIWTDEFGNSWPAAQLTTPEGGVISLVGVDPVVANDQITIGFVILNDGGGFIYGSSGDDVLYGSGDPESFVISAGEGNDVAVHFDSAEDTLFFEDGAPAASDWTEVVINGETALHAEVPGGGSVTVLGYSLADLHSLTIEDGTASTTSLLGESSLPMSDYYLA